MTPSPLLLAVPATLRDQARRAGFTLTTQPADTTATPSAVWRAWGTGRPTVHLAIDQADTLLALRPIALFLDTFGAVLWEGSFVAAVPSSGGLEVSAWRTREKGTLLLIHNPTDSPLCGSVFPAIEEITVPPQTTLPWLHDAPIGESKHYLAAYAGLVKSDALPSYAHVRPDPFEGARLFVQTEPGAPADVVLFNGGRGCAVTVTAGDVPSVVAAEQSQVVALTGPQAERLWFDPAHQHTLIGPDDVRHWGDGSATVVPGPLPCWHLAADGTVTALPIGTPRDRFDTPGWYTALFSGASEPSSAQLILEGVTPDQVWLNGERVAGTALALAPGENRLCLHLVEPAPFGNVLVLPDGACYLQELTEWTHGSDQPRTISLPNT